MCQTISDPFAAAARNYRDKDWLQTIPCAGKTPLVRGYHGRKKKLVTNLDINRWLYTPRFVAANIGVVMPTFGRVSVIGLDVDKPSEHKAEGDGAATLAGLEAELGALPPTWTNGHGDPTSPYRHRFYLVKDMERVSQLGPGVDLLTAWNRYAIVWPSVHRSGEMYEWADPDGHVCGIPDPKRLPMLPDAWRDRILRNAKSALPLTDLPHVEDLSDWQAQLDADRHQPCPYMQAVIRRWYRDPYCGCSSRHDGLLRLYHGMLAGEARGHVGATLMAGRIAHDFATLVSDRSDAATALREAYGMWTWVQHHVLPPRPGYGDPCNPFAGMAIGGRQEVAA